MSMISVQQSLPQFEFVFAKEEHLEELVELVTDVWYSGNVIVKKLELSREELRDYLNVMINHLLNVADEEENLVVVDRKTSK